ncbi:MAG: hypothetical protein HY280_06745 [Nitrospinae bacterium]|nr:hypothetical protein [Nitrospinota bacterium]
MRRIGFIVLVLTILSAGASFALPLKIIMIPSTDVQPYGTFHLGIEEDTTMFTDQGNGGHSNPTDFGLTTGIFNSELLLVDIGVDVKEASPSGKPFDFNAKIATTEEAFGKIGPLLAVGVYDLGPDVGVNNFNIGYGSASKVFGFLGRATIGYFYGNPQMMKAADGTNQSQGVMFGYDRRMTELNEKLWFGIDYFSGRSVYGAVSFGIGWTFSEKASLILGYVRYNDITTIIANLPNLPGTNAPPTNGVGANVVTWQAHFDF